jgi:hypothetical protein
MSVHVQDLVPVVSVLAQPLSGRPHLRRVAVDDLRRDDLVHRQVQAGVVVEAAADNGPLAIIDRRLEIRVGGADEQRAIVRIFGIEQGRIDVLRRLRSRRDGKREASLAVGVDGRRHTP